MGKKKNKKKSRTGVHTEFLDALQQKSQVKDCGEHVDGDHGGNMQEKMRKAPPQYSVDQLMDKVDEYMNEFNYELAQRFCQRALDMEPDNVRVLHTCGILLLEMDDLEKAKQCFTRAIALSPDSGHSQYMYLGQLLTGADAIASFTKGVELMKKKLETQQASVDTSDEVTVQDISNAYCAIAEIYLTDECMSSEAEEACRGCLENAIQSDSGNPEAFQLMASFLLSQDDKEKAKEMIEKGVSLWLPKMEEADRSEGGDVDPVFTCSLSYPARVNAAKILIELESYDTASQVLELLLDEEDEVVEVWYLLGWLNYLQKEDFLNNARFYLTKANEVAIKTKFDDETMLKHISELLEELGPEPDEEPVDGAEDQEDEMEDEDEMETDDTSKKGGATESMEH